MSSLKTFAHVTIHLAMHKIGHDSTLTIGYCNPPVDFHAIWSSIKCLWFSFGC